MQINFEFSDLPLVIANGIEAGFVNGQAEVTYVSGDEWTIGSISLEGFGERVNGVRQWPQIDAPIPIAGVIRSRLYNEWSSKVQDAVNEAIEDDRACAADDYADMKREARMMERA